MRKPPFPILLVSLTITLSLSNCALIVNYSDSSTVEKRSLGINLFASHLDYCEDRLFADAMKTARSWKEPGYYGNGDEVETDDLGWPTEDAELIVWHGIENMNGTYYLEGESATEPTISTGYGGGSLENFQYADGIFSAELVVTHTGSNGLLLIFEETGGGVSNVKLMKPLSPGSGEYYSTDVDFTDTAKDLVAPFDVVRFMWSVDCWNGPWQETWEDRVDPDYCSFNRSYSDEWSEVSWAGCGMAWEYAIAFANETGKDVWINMPIGADDDYIESLAQLWYDSYTVEDGVIYWEYSNEATWDGSRCSSYMSTMATDSSADYYDTISFDGSTDENILKSRYYAMRSVEMSQIWRDVWGDNMMMTRVRPVHCGQLTYNFQGIQGLKFVHNYYNNGGGDYVNDPQPVSYYFYGCGGSHYTGDDPDEETDDDEAEYDGYSQIEVFEKYEEEEACLAKMYGLERVAYEGGIWTDSESYEESRISSAMVEYHELWEKYDGKMLMYYVTTGGEDSGTALGFTTDAFDLETRKYEGVEELLSDPKDSPRAGQLVPCTIEGADYSGSSIAWQHPEPAAGETTGYAELSTWYVYKAYLFRTKEAGDYNITLTTSNTTGTELEIMVDGEILGVDTLVGTTSDTYTVTLDEGLHAIRVKRTEEGYLQLKSIVIE
ncbi:MAG: hypothetical protein PQJ59_04180 [Spirochaetales bacterium]|nr:hypothetical protein [Spirochaetales bacterium]